MRAEALGVLFLTRLGRVALLLGTASLGCGEVKEPPVDAGGTSAVSGGPALGGASEGGSAPAVGGTSQGGGGNSLGGAAPTGGTRGDPPTDCEDPGYEGLPEPAELDVVEADPEVTMLQPSSGTRLKVRYLVDDDSFEAPFDFYDTLHEVACRIRRTADGQLRCTPSTEELYVGDDDPACPYPSQGEEPSADADLVRFERSSVELGARIQTPVLIGEDGARVVAFSGSTIVLSGQPLLPPLRGLTDVALGSAVDWESGESRLTPPRLHAWTTQPFESCPNSACLEALPFFRLSFSPCDPDPWTHVRLDQRQIFEVKLATADTYECFCSEGGCRSPENIPMPQEGLRATARVPFDAWEPVQLLRLAQGRLSTPPRLAIEGVVLRELAEPIFDGPDGVCVPQIASDGQLRCLPGSRQRYFLDSSCTQPAVWPSEYRAGMLLRSSDAPFSIDATAVHVYTVGEQVEASAMFQRFNGPCEPQPLPAPTNVYAAGAEVEPATFAPLRLETR